MNILTTSSDILSRDITTRFFAFLDVSQPSARSYFSGIKQFITFLHSKSVTVPTRETIIDFKKSLVAKGKKTATIALYLSALQRFFD